MMKFWIPFGLLSLLFLTVLELNKNTLVGWVFTIVVLAIFAGWFVTRLAGKAWYVKGFSWLALVAVFAIIVYLTWPPLKSVPALEKAAKEQGVTARTQEVQTQFGPVAGVHSEDFQIKVFAGIPYAAPPVGELRWRPPQDPEPWTETLLCDHFARMAMQTTNLPIYNSLTQIIGYHDYKISLKDNYREGASEDCLYLNVWTPEHAAPDSKLPVVVYIHGGSLQTGQPWYQDYSGEAFARDGVICVNMGYRLGVFGFLADETLLAEDGTTGN